MAHILDTVPEEYLELLPEFLLNPDPYIYLSDNFVTFDLETTKKGDDGSPSAVWPENSIVCGSWCWGADGGVQNIYGNEHEMSELVSAIEEADFCVAHNGKFDLMWLIRAGIDLHKIILYDTMIGEYVRLGNRKGEGYKHPMRWDAESRWGKKYCKQRTDGPLALNTLIQRELGAGKRHFIAACMSSDVCPSEMPRSMVLTRCDEDVEYTRDLFLIQRVQLNDLDLLPCVYTRSLLSMPLADIEMNGMHLDKEAVVTEYNDVSLKLAAVTAELDEFMGGLNPNSTKQMKEFIYGTDRKAGQLAFKPHMKGRGKNKEPNYTTATDDLLALKATNARQRKFLELKQAYARHNADMTKAMLFFHSVVTDPKYDKPTFHAQFNQCVTVTHRLSSSGVSRVFDHVLDKKGKPLVKGIQLQNAPRKYKPMFCPRNEGWDMGEADGSQLEFRVAAFLGNCPIATQAIVSNTDIHTQTATVLTDNGQETDRQGAKEHTFKPLYGGQSGSEAEVAYYEWFRAHYTGIGEAQQAWKDQAVVRKQVILPHKFRFYFPNAKLNRSGYVEGSTNICNYPVQHFATAEIIPIAICYLWQLMRPLESFMVNTVHDSVISELHPDEQGEYKERAKYSFTTLVYHYLKEVYDVEFNVPLGVGVKIGHNWGKGHEQKTAPMPPYLQEGIDYSELLTEWVDD